MFHRIIITEKHLLTEFVDVKPFDTLSEEGIMSGTISRDVNVRNAPLHLAGLNRNANWMEFGFSQIADIDKTWEMMMKYSSYMDSELLLLLSKIQSNSALAFFRTMKSIYPTIKEGLQLRGYETEMVKLWHFIQEQDSYYNRVFAQYKKE